MTKYKVHKFPKTRIATIDICEIGKRKHHVTCLIELDISKSRKKIENTTGIIVTRFHLLHGL